MAIACGYKDAIDHDLQLPIGHRSETAIWVLAHQLSQIVGKGQPDGYFLTAQTIFTGAP